MKNRVCIIICYFGKLPDTIDSFIYSCKCNSEFNWLIFTDCDLEDVPTNMSVERIDLAHIKRLAENKLNMAINLETPYKLCDYKVAYGLIFEDYLQNYDFWGYGDFDVIYGNLKEFITDDILDNYDKIYPLGHLSLMRNNEECCKLFMKEVKCTSSYLSVFSTSVSCFFDENRGINDKLEAFGIRIYTKFEFADIDGTYRRFRVVDKKTLRLTLPSFRYFEGLRKNYRKQIFYYANGHLYQRHLEKGKLADEEISYIHYRRKLKVLWQAGDPVMLITPAGLIGVQSVPDIEYINKYNGVTENELLVYLIHASHRIWARFIMVSRDRIITLLGKSQKLRGLIHKFRT